mmetsp:Transcript_31067/g.66132  ORF Transcript_31067/g.66132 Transcript_31067/m.66132 type:complete len:261 (-) Transcript_31067:83-865(-)
MLRFTLVIRSNILAACQRCNVGWTVTPPAPTELRHAEIVLLYALLVVQGYDLALATDCCRALHVAAQGDNNIAILRDERWDNVDSSRRDRLLLLRGFGRHQTLFNRYRILHLHFLGRRCCRRRTLALGRCSVCGGQTQLDVHRSRRVFHGVIPDKSVFNLVIASEQGTSKFIDGIHFILRRFLRDRTPRIRYDPRNGVFVSCRFHLRIIGGSIMACDAFPAVRPPPDGATVANLRRLFHSQHHLSSAVVTHIRGVTKIPK